MGRRTVLPLFLVSSLGLLGCEEAKPKLGETKPPLVVVSPAVTDYVIDYEDFTGKTDAVFSVDVRARSTGYLEKVHFKDGDEVKEGDLLFEIDPRPYQADLARAEATLNQSEAHFSRLDADFHRAKNLYSRNSIGREEYDKIQGDRAEAEAMVGIARATRDLAKLSLGFTKITAPIAGRLSRRMVDPGNLVKADDTILTSIVSLDPMYVYFDVDERTLLRIRRLVREGRVKTRQEAEVPVLVALSDEEGFPHKGTINFSDNKVDPNTGTLRVRGIIENPPLKGRSMRVLSPGLFTRVRLPIGSPHKEVLIPEEAIGTDQGRKYLYVVKDEKKKDGKGPSKDDKDASAVTHVVVDRTVKVGPSHGGLRVVTEGLKANEMVIVSGLQRVRPGSKVETRLKEPAPSDAASQTALLGGAPSPVGEQAKRD
jgi:RND family efflux transporter MFP subunit